MEGPEKQVIIYHIVNFLPYFWMWMKQRVKKNTMESKTGGLISQVIKGAVTQGKPGQKLL